MTVTIYTRLNCPLCERGIAAAVRVYGEDRITLVDVDLDLVLMEKYTNRVPVIESADGTVVSEGIIDVRVLRNHAERQTTHDQR
ncbi:MAG: glutaredoxin family protein [Actinomycetota bacterium]